MTPIDWRKLADSATPLFVVAWCTGMIVQGAVGTMAMMVLVSAFLYRAIVRSRIEPS